MDRDEPSRRAAQHELLNALRKFCPEPLVELRMGAPGVDSAADVADDRPRLRSRARAARIREARRRVAKLPPGPAEAPPPAPVDVDSWAARWGLGDLRDLAADG